MKLRRTKNCAIFGPPDITQTSNTIAVAIEVAHKCYRPFPFNRLNVTVTISPGITEKNQTTHTSLKQSKRAYSLCLPLLAVHIC